MSIAKHYETTITLAQSGQNVTVTGVASLLHQVTAVTFLTGPRGLTGQDGITPTNLTETSLVITDSSGVQWLFTVNPDGSWQSTLYSSTDPIGPVLHEDGLHYLVNEDGSHYLAQES